MENNGSEVTLNEKQLYLKDIKQHLRRLYDIMNRGVTEGSSTAKEVNWMARQMGNHDTRIEDKNLYLYELMGTISYMKEDLHKLVNMNQCNHC